jgi:hypothetical protein
MQITDGDPVVMLLNGAEYQTTARLDETVPADVVLVPRSMGILLVRPAAVEIKVYEMSTA